MLVRRASAAADGIYFIYEDRCRSVKPRLDSNESTAVKTEAASTHPHLTTTQFGQKYHRDDFPVCHKKTIQNLWFTNCLSFYTSNCAPRVRGLSALVGFPQKPALKRGKGTQALFRQVFFLMFRFLCWWGQGTRNRKEPSLPQNREVSTERVLETKWRSQRGEWPWSVGPVFHTACMTDCAQKLTEKLMSITQSRNRTNVCIAHKITAPKPFQFQITFYYGLGIP